MLPRHSLAPGEENPGSRRRASGRDVVWNGSREPLSRDISLRQYIPEATATLSWKDLSVSVGNSKTILDKLTGLAVSGRLLAIMGPSGSGKTTLLHSLRGRPSRDAIVTGDILLNGNSTRPSFGNTAFLAQEVDLLGTLTVYETVYYSARVRFADKTTDEETKAIVKSAIADVGLTRAMHTPIGSWQRRGISGGEKRRVSIAVELLTSPLLIFLDEPTSGLDSASSYHVISTLKGLARDGRTIISVIHQPSSEAFDLFDDLCLLSGGRQVYFGSVPGALQFFTSNGFPCPHMRNPSDHYLLTINSDFDNVIKLIKETEVERMEDEDMEDFGSGCLRARTAAEAVQTLTTAYAASKEKQDVEAKVLASSKIDGAPIEGKSSEASFLRQSIVLTRRSFVNMWRDAGYFWLRLLMYMALCVAIATVFYDVGHSYNAIQARAASISFAVSFFTFMCVGGFPSFIEDMKVFTMERMNGHYRVAAFVVGNTISSAPFLFLISIVCALMMYFLIGLHPGFSHFAYFTLALFACLLAAESLMMAISSLVPNFLFGIVVGAGIQGMFMIVGGFYRLPRDVPDPVWRYPLQFMAFHFYGQQGFFENEFAGETFDNVNPSLPRITGEEILKRNFQVDVGRSKWLNFLILIIMAAVYRVVFYIFIRLSESFFPAVLMAIKKKVRTIRFFSSTKIAVPTSPQ